jgi:hypothetical protein
MKNNLNIIMKKESKKMQKAHQELLEFEKRVVGELDISNKKFTIPEKYALTKTKRRLVIKMPFMTRVDIVCKGDWQTQTQQWFRQKGKDKPYIPEGFVEIDGDVFKITENKKVLK